jgi:hypothetical protein
VLEALGKNCVQGVSNLIAHGVSCTDLRYMVVQKYGPSL